ncbi:hypothetical protein BRARA_D02460 [Brassica rapa]|uniref:Uncharacterized protein n=1 Tax=Brassica campestris TaxID=3711 RepID=A0A397ZP29_BRACM|nr:hypothetical protein BRARA_D02460 [Brassica rapa]
MDHPDWILKGLELEKLRNFVISYAERDSVTAVQALKRVSAVVKGEGEENKDWLRYLHLSPEQHPWPIFSGEEGKAALISHLLDLMNVIESDFEVLRKHLGKEDPKTAPQGVFTSRLLVSSSRSKMLQKINGLVDEEIRAQKAEDLELLIWKVKTRTLEHLMLGLVVQKPNQLEKLKRIEKCLCDVICDGRVFIITNRFVPQPEFFPVVQVSQSMDQEQHVSNAQELIDLLVEFLDLIGGCDIGKLRKDKLDETKDMVTKILADLEETALAEGGVYQENL